MPFLKGYMPLRRTLFYLNQGDIVLRDSVRIFTMGFHPKANELQKGARDFVFWHWAQLQWRNPRVQLIKYRNITVTPYAQAFLENGEDILLDFEGKTREQIVETIRSVLCKTQLSMRREIAQRAIDHNPSNFGSFSERHCICEVQGQQPCTALLPAPNYIKGSWRWNRVKRGGE